MAGAAHQVNAEQHVLMRTMSHTHTHRWEPQVHGAGTQRQQANTCLGLHGRDRGSGAHPAVQQATQRTRVLKGLACVLLQSGGAAACARINSPCREQTHAHQPRYLPLCTQAAICDDGLQFVQKFKQLLLSSVQMGILPSPTQRRPAAKGWNTGQSCSVMLSGQSRSETHEDPSR